MAGLADQLLRTCPALQVLATSRAATAGSVAAATDGGTTESVGPMTAVTRPKVCRHRARNRSRRSRARR